MNKREKLLEQSSSSSAEACPSHEQRCTKALEFDSSVCKMIGNSDMVNFIWKPTQRDPRFLNHAEMK